MLSSDIPPYTLVYVNFVESYPCEKHGLEICGQSKIACGQSVKLANTCVAFASTVCERESADLWTILSLKHCWNWENTTMSAYTNIEHATATRRAKLHSMACRLWPKEIIHQLTAHSHTHAHKHTHTHTCLIFINGLRCKRCYTICRIQEGRAIADWRRRQIPTHTSPQPTHTLSKRTAKCSTTIQRPNAKSHSSAQRRIYWTSHFIFKFVLCRPWCIKSQHTR